MFFDVNYDKINDNYSRVSYSKNLICGESSQTKSNRLKILKLNHLNSFDGEIGNENTMRRKAITNIHQDEDSEDSELIDKTTTSKLLDKYQDELLLHKLIKVTNMAKSKGSNQAGLQRQVNNYYNWLSHKLVAMHNNKNMKSLVFATLTYDNKSIITIEKNKDDNAFVRCYILDKNAADRENHERLYQMGDKSSHASMDSINSIVRRELCWQVEIIGDASRIKIDCLKQNSNSTLFAFVYQDDGNFFLQVITNKGRVQYLVDINHAINLDIGSKPIRMCSTPLIVASEFIDDSKIFVNLYHRIQRIQHHLLVDFKKKKILSKGSVLLKEQQQKIICTNYPIESFYLKSKKRFFCFYRQGELIEIGHKSLNVQQSQISDKIHIGLSKKLTYTIRQLTKQGTTLLNNKRPNTQINISNPFPLQLDQIFYLNLRVFEDDPVSETKELFICMTGGKLSFYDFNKLGAMERYYTLHDDEIGIRQFANISYVSGDYRFQMIMSHKIYIFKLVFDETKQKFMANIESTLNNYMNCTQLLFSRNGHFAISYKHLRQNLYVFERKYLHKFKVTINNNNYQGCIVVSIRRNLGFIICKAKNIEVFAQNQYRIQKIQIYARPKDEQIIQAVFSHNEERLAIALGKTTHGSEQGITCIIIYNLFCPDKTQNNNFLALNEINRKDTEFSSLTSIQFQFCLKSLDQFIMFDSKNFFFHFNVNTGQALDYDCSNLGDRKKIQQSLKFRSQLEYICFNNEQSKVIIGDENFGLILLDLEDSSGKGDLDIYKTLQLSYIKYVIYNKGFFYILANRVKDTLGLYLLSLDENTLQANYIINWENKIQFDDARLDILNHFKDKKDSQEKQKATKNDKFVIKQRQESLKQDQIVAKQSIVVSYNTQYLNTFNLISLSLSNKRIEFWYETHALFEEDLNGLLLTDGTFLILDRLGMHMVSLVKSPQPRKIKSWTGCKQKLHSISSMLYLKATCSNHIKIQDIDSQQAVIFIQDMLFDDKGKSQFFQLFRVAIHSCNLRQLLLLQSLSGAHSEQMIYDLIQQQSSLDLFFQNLFELDVRSFITYQAKHKSVLEYLLKGPKSPKFQSMYPIFFVNRDGSSVFDMLLDQNLMLSTQILVEFIVKYQNMSSSSTLFKKSLVLMISRSIKGLQHLLDSQIFLTRLEHEFWPIHAHDNQQVLKPYNGCFVHTHYKFLDLFGDIKDRYSQFNEEIFNTSTMQVQHMWVRRQSLQGLSKQHLQRIKNTKQGQQNSKFKIAYFLNKLPNFNNVKNGQQIIDAILECEDLHILRSEAIKQMSKYYWDTYAKFPVLVAFIVHCCYIIFQFLYIYNFYLINQEDWLTTLYLIFMIFPLIFELVFDWRKIRNSKTHLISRLDKFLIIFYYVLGFTNLLAHLLKSKINAVFKLLLILQIGSSFQKLIQQLRMFNSLSYIVTMGEHVSKQLFGYFVFYFCFVVMIGQMIAISDSDISAMHTEYDKLSFISRRMVNSIKLHTKKFDETGNTLNYLTQGDLTLSLLLRTVTVIFIGIAYTRLIIGEIMTTFKLIHETIDIQVEKGRLQLVRESQLVLGQHWAWNGANTQTISPKAVIVRQQDKQNISVR